MWDSQSCVHVVAIAKPRPTHPHMGLVERVPIPTATDEIFDLSSESRPLEIVSPGQPSRVTYRVYPPTQPSSRLEVRTLATALESMLQAAGSSTTHALEAWDHTFAELVPQVFVHCSDRGELLGRVRRAYGHYISELIKRLRALEVTEREALLERLMDENAKLKEDMEAEGIQRKRSGVVNLLQRATAASKGASEAKASVEKNKTEGQKSGGFVQTSLDKFNAASQVQQLGM